MQEVIKLENVTWQRQGCLILDQVNWQVQAGEQWAILGLNGSGKTSILNIVTGYTFPTSGQVEVLGETFGRTNIPKLRERIGFVSSALDRFGTTFNRQAAKNLVLSGKFASIGIYSNMEVAAADHELAEQLMENLGIIHLKAKRFSTLSQGEQRRVLIARALMADPELLILDEPCSGLDLLAREDILAMIETIAGQESKRQLLYVTHYVEEITEAISHVLLIADGQVVAAGPKHEVLTKELLEETYRVPLTIRWENDRPWLTIQR